MNRYTILISVFVCFSIKTANIHAFLYLKHFSNISPITKSFLKYLPYKSRIWKRNQGGIFTRTQGTNLHQIFCEFMLNFKVVIKSMIDPDNIWKNLGQEGVNRPKCVSNSLAPLLFIQAKQVVWVLGLTQSRPWHSKPPDNFDDFSLTKVIFWKNMMEKYWLDTHKQLFFKYFVNICLIKKLFSKVWLFQTTLVKAWMG